MTDTVNGNSTDNADIKSIFMPIIHFILSIALFILSSYLSRFARNYLSQNFDPVWIFIIWGYVRPLLYLCSGWLFINGLNKSFFNYPFTCKISKNRKTVSKVLLIILTVFLVICFLNVLPPTIRFCALSWFHIDLLSAYPWLSFVFTESGSSFLLGKLGTILYLYLQEENTFIFIPLGIIWWYLRLPNSKVINEKNKEINEENVSINVAE